MKSSEINLRNGALLQAHLPQPLKALQGGMYIPQSISCISLYSKSDKIIRDTLCRAAVHCLAMSSVLFFLASFYGPPSNLVLCIYQYIAIALCRFIQYDVNLTICCRSHTADSPRYVAVASEACNQRWP